MAARGLPLLSVVRVVRMKGYKAWFLEHEPSGFYFCSQPFLDQRKGWGRHDQVLCNNHDNAMMFKSESDAWRYLAEENNRQFLENLKPVEISWLES